MWAAVALLSVEVVVLLLLFSGALFTFIQVVTMVFKEKREDFDVRAFGYLSKHVSIANTGLMEFFTFLGTHLFLIPANLLLIAYFLFIKQHRWYSIKFPVVALSSLLLMFFLKFIFHRTRPLTPLLQQAQGYSFPSGHALMSVTFYGLLIVVVWQNINNTFLKWVLVIMLFALIIAIGISRVYLRVHYASDVIAGFCLGFIWLILSLWVIQRFEKYSRKKIDPGMRYTLIKEDQGSSAII